MCTGIDQMKKIVRRSTFVQLTIKDLGKSTRVSCEVTVLIYIKGKGVNIVLDCVGASYWEKNLASLALEGRWVLYGLLSK